MVARFPPFPPLQASLEVWALLRAAIKTAELNVRSPGVYRVLKHSFRCFSPEKRLNACLSSDVEASPHF